MNALNVFVGKQNDNLSVADSVNIYDKYFLYYFDLGTISNTPVYVSKAYHYEYDIKTSLQFSKAKTETIQNQLSIVNETINTDTINAGIEFSVKGGIPAILEAGFKFGFEGSNSITNSISTSEQIINTYLNNYSEGFGIEVDFNEASGFVKGNYYRISFYEVVKVYAILVYDVEKDSYNYSFYEYLTSSSEVYGFEESEDGVFDYSNKKTLSFDLDNAIALSKKVTTVKRVEEEQKVQKITDEVSFVTPGNKLVFDLSRFETPDALKDFNYEHFQNNELIIKPKYDYNPIYEIVLIGSYGYELGNGDIIKNVFDGFKITFDGNWDRPIILTLVDFGCYTIENQPFLSTLNDSIINIEGEVFIHGKGGLQECVIKTGNLVLDGVHDSALLISGDNATVNQGMTCLICDDVKVNTIFLSLTAPDGSSGENGGTGVKLLDKMIIDKGASVEIFGGNGGKGTDGKNSTIVGVKGKNRVNIGDSNGGKGGTGGNGEDGKAGGNGGTAINGNLAIISGSCKLIAGNGADGGTGGNGGAGGDGGRNQAWGGKNGDGGDGGRGGNGGNGGDAGIGITGSLSGDTNQCVIQNGMFGLGGSGGKGGAAGAAGVVQNLCGGGGVPGNNGASGTKGLDGK